MKLEERLTALRKENGLSQADLAEKLSVSRQAISRWEQGISAPSTENLIALAKLYGVPLDHLVQDQAREDQDAEGSKEPPKKTSIPPAPPEEHGAKRKISWRLAAACFICAMGILLAVLFYSSSSAVPDENKGSLSEIAGEEVGAIPKGNFTLEDW